MRLTYRLIVGDSREELKKIEGNSVKLVVTSPPYFMQTTYSTKESDVLVADLSRIENMKDYFTQLEIIWNECWRIVKSGGYMVVNWRDLVTGSRLVGYPREFCLAGDMVKSVEKAGFHLISRWIWHKYKYYVAHLKAKYALYENLRDADPRCVSDWEYCFAFKKRGERKVKEMDFSLEEWKNWCSGVWEITASKDSERFEDESEAAYYPVEIPLRFIKIYTEPGDVVLDPFLGSGTTMLAAKMSQRSCIGVELHEKKREMIKKKIGWFEQSLLGDELRWLE